MEMAIHLRPENIATVLDVIEMRRQISQYHKRLEEHICMLQIQGSSDQSHKEMEKLAEDVKIEESKAKGIEEVYFALKRQVVYFSFEKTGSLF